MKSFLCLIFLSICFFNTGFADTLALLKEAKQYHEQRDYTKAAELLEQAATQGDAVAQSMLVLVYSDGLGVEEDHSKAAYWYEKAVAQNNADAQVILAVLHLGDELPYLKDEAKALEFVTQAAMQGNAKGQFVLGGMYFDGKGIERDTAKGFEWFEKAQAQDFPDAIMALAEIYTYGLHGIEKDYARAIQLYEKAIPLNVENANARLAFLYANGFGVLKNNAKAIELFEKHVAPMSENGKGRYYNSLGVQYADGYDLPKDDALAAYWYEKAATLGIMEAQYSLAKQYYHGTGVTQDLAQAKYWMEKAAQQDWDAAQYALAMMYLQGEGAAKDYSKALEWFEKAANKNNREAMYHLGVIYFDGLGKARDRALATQWLEKAIIDDRGNQEDVPLEQRIYGARKWNSGQTSFSYAADASYRLGILYAQNLEIEQNFVTAKAWFGIACDNELQKGCDQYRELNEKGY